MTPDLAARLSPEQKEDFCKRKITVGGVFRFHTRQTTPPKIKRLVIAGIRKDINSVGFVFFNSNQAPNPKLASLQLSFSFDKRPFLDRSCYLDCAFLKEWGFDHLLGKCIANPQIFLGQLSQEDSNLMLNALKKANTVSTRVKNRYGLN